MYLPGTVLLHFLYQVSGHTLGRLPLQVLDHDWYNAIHKAPRHE